MDKSKYSDFGTALEDSRKSVRELIEEARAAHSWVKLETTNEAIAEIAVIAFGLFLNGIPSPIAGAIALRLYSEKLEHPQPVPVAETFTTADECFHVAYKTVRGYKVNDGIGLAINYGSNGAALIEDTDDAAAFIAGFQNWQAAQ